jgi:hypothetical protein
MPKFDVERICRAAAASGVPERMSKTRAASSRTIGANTAGKSEAVVRVLSRLVAAPSYVELLTCLEMAKQAKELREKSNETVGRH